MYGAQPPPGATLFIIESGEPCSCEACGSRTWDHGDVVRRKPAFVGMSDAEWSSFSSRTGWFVSKYYPEGRTGWLSLVFILIGIVVFHPAIGVVGRGMMMSGREEDDYGRRRRLSSYDNYTAGCMHACNYGNIFANGSQCYANTWHAHWANYTRLTHNISARYDQVTSSTCGGTSCGACWHDPCYAEINNGSKWLPCLCMNSAEMCTQAQRDLVPKQHHEAWCEGSWCDGGEDGGVFSVSGLLISLFLMIFFIVGGVAVQIKLAFHFIGLNQKVDTDIQAYLAELSGRGGAHFQLLTMWTQKCKPKGARTYRAVAVSPAGAAGGLVQAQVVSAVSGIAMPVMPVAAAVAVPVDPVGNALPAGGSDPVVKLEQLQSMLDKGLVTQAEYDKKRAEILAAM